MIIIGVTGNAGAGKSTVSTIIKNNLGCTVISADNLAKKVNIPGSEYYEKTLEMFGEEILNEDKSIDRKALAKILFSDAEIKRKMDALTAKYIGAELLRLAKEENKNPKNEFLVLDVPLLYECGIYKICNYVIAVTCEEEETKIDRIVERDRRTKAEAKAIINSQPDNEFYISKADYSVFNNKDSSYLNLIKGVIKIIRDIKMKNNK